MVKAYNSKTIVHVKAGGSGDGSSWANAFSDLQKGIDKAYGVAKNTIR